ncbi:MAG: glycosyltransferase [Bacteroidales bacterium]|nr:glycosyltransferase [Bacteroidales bacterium]
MYLSIIIPLYNEAGVIETTLGRLSDAVMPRFVEKMEVIIVDDCSTDNSAALTERFALEWRGTVSGALTVSKASPDAGATTMSKASPDTGATTISKASPERSPAILGFA